MNNKISISEVKTMSQEVFDAFGSLTPQLSSSSSLPTYSELEEIVKSNATILFIAHDEGANKIVGSLTLVLFRIPTGVRAWVEDVVVDLNYRGQGIGQWV